MAQQQTPQDMTMMPDPNQQDLSGNYHPQESDLTGGLPINRHSLRDGPPGSNRSTLILHISGMLGSHGAVN